MRFSHEINLKLYILGFLFSLIRLMMCKSVDSSRITAFTVHECDAATRMGSRPRRFLFTGHGNGSLQVSQLAVDNYFLLSHLVLQTNSFP